MFPNDNRFQLANILPPFYVLVMGVIFGGSMIFLTPPFNVPEEDQHFYRSYQCSQGVIYAARNDNSVGGRLPASLVVVNHATVGFPKNEYEFCTSVEKIDKALSVPLDPVKRMLYGFPVTVR